MELDTTPAQPEVPTGMTEDQAASALLEKWGAREETSPEADQPTEAPEPEADEATPGEEDVSDGESSNDEEADESAEESADIELDVAGEKFKLPKAAAEQVQKIQTKLKEAEAGHMRKFQEAAELRKNAEAGIEQAKRLSELAHKQSDLIADHKMVTRRLASLEQIDVAALGQTDPAKLTMINAEYNQLMAAKSRIEAAYGQSAQEFQQEDQKALTERFERLETYAKANVKGWTPEYSEQLAKFAESKGLSREWLKANLNEGLLAVIADAHYGNTVKTATLTQKRVAEPSKTLKPGAQGNVKTASVKKADDAMGRLKKSGSWQDAASALLARSNSRKR